MPRRPTMSKRLAAALAIATVIGMIPAGVGAQSTGSIAGIISDESGAVLPGVTLEVSNIATGQLRTAITGVDGYYAIPLLQPGTYDVKATLAGFKPMIRKHNTVTV